MGWYGIYGAKPKDIVLDVLRDLGDSVVDHKTTCYGRHLWVLAKLRSTNKSFISLYLIEKRDSEWMYKPMDETMHPYYYDCPLSLLNAADEPINESSQRWREKVQYYHDSRRQNR